MISTLGDVRLVFLHTFPVDAHGPLDAPAFVDALCAQRATARWDGKLRNDFEVVEGFLGNPLRPALNVRAQLDGLEATVGTWGEGEKPRRHSVSVVVTLYPRVGIASLMFAMSLRGCSVDEVILVSQGMSGRAGLGFELPAALGGDPRSASVRDVAQRYARLVQRALSSPERDDLFPALPTRIIEVRLTKEDGDCDPDTLVDEGVQAFYGMASMDEGWQHVPVDVARARLERTWATRRHFRVLLFDRCALLIDGQHHPGCEYRGSQATVRERFGLPPDPYFGVETNVGGLNHGPLLLAEVCAVRSAVLERMEEALRAMHPKGVTELMALRQRILGEFDEIQRAALPELGVLERMVMDVTGVTERLGRIERRLERLETDLGVQYSQDVDRKMVWLTRFTVLLAVAQIVETLVLAFR